MATHVIEFDEECKPCKGTGIFVGMAELDGAGVVCYKCAGTGCHRVKIEYSDFDCRRTRSDVQQVYEVNPGILVGVGRDGEFSLSDFGGQSYDDWAAGAPFVAGMEMRRFTCPAWWYQTANYELKPNWKECGFGSFSACRHFGSKRLCWARWDKEHNVISDEVPA